MIRQGVSARVDAPVHVEVERSGANDLANRYGNTQIAKCTVGRIEEILDRVTAISRQDQDAIRGSTVTAEHGDYLDVRVLRRHGNYPDRRANV